MRARAARDGLRRPAARGLLEQLGVELNERGNVGRDADYRPTSTTCSSCGDMGRGQSLIVWAIAEGPLVRGRGRRCLMGETVLPAPITPDAVPMR